MQRVGSAAGNHEVVFVVIRKKYRRQIGRYRAARHHNLYVLADLGAGYSRHNSLSHGAVRRGLGSEIQFYVINLRGRAAGYVALRARA